MDPFAAPMETSHWTVEDHIDWIRQYAQDEKMMGLRALSWKVDTIGTYIGLTEVIDWPKDGRPITEGSRIVFPGDGYAYLMQDVK